MTLLWIGMCVGAAAGIVAGLMAWQEQVTRKTAYERFAEALREKLGSKHREEKDP